MSAVAPRLSGDPLPDEFAEAFERARPRFGRLGVPLVYFANVGSTNDVAAHLASTSDCEGAVVIADAQTAGRGRRGRTWHSPPASGLYVSVVLEPARARADHERATRLLTLMAGVAVGDGIAMATGFRPQIKWPNDLVVNGRKVCGILAEAVTGSMQSNRMQSIVLGYGINVAPTAFPPELIDRATSLELELGRPIDRGSVAAETLAALAAGYSDLLEGRFDAILDAWLERSPRSRGSQVAWDTPGGSRCGTTRGIDRDGALLVETGSGIERLIAGEVIWR